MRVNMQASMVAPHSILGGARAGNRMLKRAIVEHDTYHTTKEKQIRNFPPSSPSWRQRVGALNMDETFAVLFIISAVDAMGCVDVSRLLDSYKGR